MFSGRAALQGRDLFGRALRERRDLDRKVRTWPRSPLNDPWKAGIDALARRLGPVRSTTPLKVADDEFCAPSLRHAVVQAVEEGATDIVIVPSRFTPGGSHSEVEIPDEIRKLRSEHPAIEFRQAWAFDRDPPARLIADPLPSVG